MEGSHDRDGSWKPGGAVGLAMPEGGDAVSVATTHGFAGGDREAGGAGGGAGEIDGDERPDFSGQDRDAARRHGAHRRTARSAFAGQATRSAAQSGGAGRGP